MDVNDCAKLSADASVSAHEVQALELVEVHASVDQFVDSGVHLSGGVLNHVYSIRRFFGQLKP